MKRRYYTWDSKNSTREHASLDAQIAFWRTIESDPHARYWCVEQRIPRRDYGPRQERETGLFMAD